MISLLFILIGAAGGVWLRRGLPRLEELSSRAQDFLLQGLLFFTSATFGANPAVRASMGRLGLSSLLTATMAVAASALAGFLWSKRFGRTGRDTGPGENGARASGRSDEGRPSGLLPLVTAVSVIGGWTLGSLWTTQSLLRAVSTMSTLCLYGLLLSVGYDVGRERIWRRIAEYGVAALTLPLLVGIASLAGAAVAGAMALEQAGPEAGVYIFLTNLFREIITVLTSPLLSGRVPPAVGAAMGGATSMDSTLGIISRCYGRMGTVWGLVTGTALTVASPFLLSVFLRLPL